MPSPQCGSVQSLRQGAFGASALAAPSSHSSPGSRNPSPHPPSAQPLVSNAVHAAPQASVPPPPKPRMAHVNPARSSGSQISPARAMVTPSPQKPRSQPLSSTAQSTHARLPPANPRVAQVWPTTFPSHSSPGSSIPSPQLSAHMHWREVPGAVHTEPGRHPAGLESHSSNSSMVPSPQLQRSTQNPRHAPTEQV